MNAARHPYTAPERAYLMIEALVYMALVFVILGMGYAAAYKYIDHSLVLRRSAEDISRALALGERWRADVRAACGNVRLETTSSEECLYLDGASGEVAYRFSKHALSRRVGSGPWSVLLPNVQASTMAAEQRQQVTDWRWDLELEPRSRGNVKATRFRPLFTFISVPQTEARP